jgi:hypothetical protein
MANAAMTAKLKKVQAIAKKLRKDKPKLTHIEALKLAWKQIPKAKIKKVAVGAVKKKTKKISEKNILEKIHKVRKGVNDLDEAQHTHMLQKIGALMLKPFMLKHFDGGKLKSVIKFNASNLATAKKIAKKHKEQQGHKGRYSVSAY